MNDQRQRYYIKEGLVRHAHRLREGFSISFSEHSTKDQLYESLRQLGELKELIEEAIQFSDR